MHRVFNRDVLALWEVTRDVSMRAIVDEFLVRGTGDEHRDIDRLQDLGLVNPADDIERCTKPTPRHRTERKFRRSVGQVSIELPMRLIIGDHIICELLRRPWSLREIVRPAHDAHRPYKIALDASERESPHGRAKSCGFHFHQPLTNGGESNRAAH